MTEIREWHNNIKKYLFSIVFKIIVKIQKVAKSFYRKKEKKPMTSLPVENENKQFISVSTKEWSTNKPFK